MKCYAAILFAVSLLGISTASDHPAAAPAISPNAALAQCIEGNARYAIGRLTHKNQSLTRRAETVGGQHPMVAILGCADSRVPLEIIFDMGIGDIFNVRVAGNVADVDEIGTLEYGAGHLGIPLIMVLGHSKCGAVTAVVTKSHVTPNIAKLVDNILPAAEKVRKQHPDADDASLIPAVTTENVWQAIRDILTRSDEIRELVAHEKVKIVGAIYDLESGRVTVLGTHPEQASFFDTPRHKPAPKHTAKKGKSKAKKKGH